MKPFLRLLLNFLLFTGVFTLMILFIAEPLSRRLLPTGYTRTFRQDLPGLKPIVTYERTPLDIRSLSMRTVKKPPKTIRILCLGASTTDQVTQNTEDTWPGLLEKMLGEAFDGRGLKIEVGAYGRGGNRTYDTYVWAAENVPRLNPDIVILLQGINDFSFNGGPTYVSRRNVASSVDQSQRSGFSSFRSWCLSHSNLCRHLIRIGSNWLIQSKLQARDAVEWHSNNLPLLRQQRAQFPRKEKLVRPNDPIIEFKEASSAIVSLAKEKNIRTVILSQPVLWKAELSASEEAALWFPVYTPEGPVRLSGELMEAEFSKYNEFQRLLAMETQSAFVPLHQLIPRNLDTFFDDVHYTDLGSRLVAQAIYSTVAQVVTQVINEKYPGSRHETVSMDAKDPRIPR